MPLIIVIVQVAAFMLASCTSCSIVLVDLFSLILISTYLTHVFGYTLPEN